MLVMLSGIVIPVRLPQPLKAPHPMLVMLSGIVMLVRFLQPLKVFFAILVTLSGIFILVRLSQLLNADMPPFNPFPNAIKFTESSIDKLRFTDYSLDGAAISTYFYFVREISREMVIGQRSDVLGPIRLVNAMPADGRPGPVVVQVYRLCPSLNSSHRGQKYFHLQRKCLVYDIYCNSQ